MKMRHTLASRRSMGSLAILIGVAISLINMICLGGTALAEPPKTESIKKVVADEKKKPAPNHFMRIRRENGENKPPTSLQTSIVRYVPADGTRAGLTIDLIGAVHIGDKVYYQKLNKQFEKYESMLYELVAPKDHKVPAGGKRPASAIGGLQKSMQNMLGLEFQLEQIDYNKKNFLHADMTPEQFAKSMEKRDESMLKTMFMMMGQAMAQQAAPGAKSSDLDLLAALFAKDRDLAMKRVMATQFESMGGAMKILEGPKGSTLITERNKAALKVLSQEISKGKKRIAIFYGAGHMSDFHKRLLSQYKMKLQSVKWLDAWDMRDKKMRKKADK